LIKEEEDGVNNGGHPDKHQNNNYATRFNKSYYNTFKRKKKKNKLMVKSAMAYT